MFDKQNVWIDRAQFKDEPARVQELVQQLTSHLYALTACDCSLMITIRRCELIDGKSVDRALLSHSRCFVLQPAEDSTNYLVQVSLIDLDKKLSSHLTTNFDNDKRLVQAFAS
jgi:hypothetical protein